MTDRYITVASTEIPFNIQAGQSETYLIPLIVSGAPEAVTTTGSSDVIDPDVYYTALTTGGAHAITIADPSGPAGVSKKITLVSDGGNGTLTLTSAISTSLDVITFADVGDTVELIWTGSAWRILATYCVASGDSGPAVA